MKKTWPLTLLLYHIHSRVKTHLTSAERRFGFRIPQHRRLRRRRWRKTARLWLLDMAVAKLMHAIQYHGYGGGAADLKVKYHLLPYLPPLTKA